MIGPCFYLYLGRDPGETCDIVVQDMDSFWTWLGLASENKRGGNEVMGFQSLVHRRMMILCFLPDKSLRLAQVLKVLSKVFHASSHGRGVRELVHVGFSADFLRVRLRSLEIAFLFLFTII